MPSLYQAMKSAQGSVALGAAKGAGRIGYKMATNGPVTRAILGAGIGAGVGLANMDYNTGTMNASQVIKGAMVGAAAGLGVSAIKPLAKGGLFLGKQTLGFAKEAAKQAWEEPRLFAKGMYDWAKLKSALPRQLAFGAMDLTLKHPVAVGGAAGAGYLAYNYDSSMKSPALSGGQMNTQWNQQAIAAEEIQMGQYSSSGSMGSAPQMVNKIQDNFARSTQGLVQGLHRSRHS